MKNSCILLMACVSLSACTTMLNPPQASKKKITINESEVQSLVQFSDTRTETHFAHTRPASKTGYVTGNFISCFSPMPDTATQVAATLKGSASLANTLSGNRSSNVSGNRSGTVTQDTFNRQNSQAFDNQRTGGFDSSANQSGSLDGSFTTTVVELDGRTEMVVATREVFQALCLAYANGMITPTESKSLIDKTLGVMVTLANSDNKEAEAKKTEAEAKKTEAEAKKTEADAKVKAAEAALMKAKATSEREIQINLSKRLIGYFTDNSNQFESSKWSAFLSDVRVVSIFNDPYKLTEIKRTNDDELAALFADSWFEDDLSQLLEIAEIF